MDLRKRSDPPDGYIKNSWGVIEKNCGVGFHGREFLGPGHQRIAWAWQSTDVQSIDQALTSAMSDTNLNNVMCQYFPSGKITSTFQGSQILAGPPPQTVSQGDVENLVRSLY